MLSKVLGPRENMTHVFVEVRKTARTTPVDRGRTSEDPPHLPTPSLFIPAAGWVFQKCGEPKRGPSKILSWARNGSKMAHDGSKMAKDGPRWPRMASACPQDAPKLLQVGPKMLPPCRALGYYYIHRRNKGHYFVCMP